jgi:hypothetical protein
VPSLTEVLRLVVSGDSKGAQRALKDLGATAKHVEDNPIRAFRRGLSLGGDHAISFRDRIGLARQGLTKLRTEGLGGLNGAMQNFGTAVSGAVSQVAMWGTALVTAAAAGAAAVKSVIDKYVQLGLEVGKVNRLVGTEGAEGNALRVQFNMLGIDISSAESALGKFSVALGTAQRTGAGPAAAAFKRLGVDLRNSHGKLRTNADVLEEVRGKLSKLRKENLNAYRESSKDIFGRGFMTLDKWLSASAAKIRKFSRIASQSTVDWDNKNLQRALEDSRELKIKWDDIKATMGETALDGLVGDLEYVNKLVDMLPGKWKSIAQVSAFASNPVREIWGLFKKIVTTIDMILDRLRQITKVPFLPDLLSSRLATSSASTAARQPTSAQAVADMLSGFFPGLANEGIVKARPGGTIVRLAEAGEDEVVLRRSRFAAGAASSAPVVNHHWNLTVHVGSYMGTDRAATERFAGLVGDVVMRKVRLAVG